MDPIKFIKIGITKVLNEGCRKDLVKRWGGGAVAEFCARPSDSIKYNKFLDQLSNYQLSKTDSTLQN